MQLESSGTGISGWAGDEYVELSAAIDSQLGAADLARHYDRQLERAGWQRLRASQTADVAWSAWTLVDAQGNLWHGTFYLVRRAVEATHYQAVVRAERTR